MIIDTSNIIDPHQRNSIHCFYNLNDSYIFTPLKVCSRSFVRLSEINPSYCKQTLQYDTDCKLFAVIRNPFLRTRALYTQKLLFGVELRMNGFIKSIEDIDLHTWQACQTEVINIFGKDSFFNRQITFEQFVMEGIPILINKEHHYFSQNYFIPEEVNQFFRMENSNEIIEAFNIFSSDVIHTNKSKSYDNIEYTNDMKNLIYKLYFDDFKRFNYIY